MSICSLTNAAVREVGGRVGLPLPDGSVTTLHARCKRAQSAPPPAETEVVDFARRNPGFAGETHFPPELLRKIVSGLKQEDEDAGSHSERILNGGGNTSYERVNLHRQRRIPVRLWSSRDIAWYGAWSAWCRERGIQDFTGWLEAELITPSLPPQEVVFADEAQDHTPLQLAVLRSWRTRNLVLVGDDDQALYEWSGAVPEDFFLPRLPDEQERVLGASFRVPRQVHALAQRIIYQVSRRREKAYAPRDEEGYVRREPTSILSIQNGDLPDGVEHGEGTAMILTTCRYMLKPVVATLRERGIPFHNPYSQSADLNPLRHSLPVLKGFLQGGWSWGQVAEWAALLAEGTAFRKREKAKLLAYAKEHPDDPATYERLSEAFLPEALSLLMGRNLALFAQPRRVMSVGANWDYAIRVCQKVEVEPRVILGTVHSVKGGEADHVHIYPDLSPAGFADYSTRQGRDRINRLAYVAVTRARRGVTLHLPDGPRAFMI